jgi:hypothetical protein
MSFQLYNTENNIEIIDFELKKYMWRTFSGVSTNTINPSWGSSGISLERKSQSAYGDGISTFSRTIPNPRTVSNIICKQSVNTSNTMNLTNMMWVWGQFLNHTIDLTSTNSSERVDILTPSTPEEEFPGRTIMFSRSSSVSNTLPREQPNTMSSYIDATNVYGFNDERSIALRMCDGTGKLKTSFSATGEVMLPFNIDGLDNRPTKGSSFYLTGDVRANENICLLSMHTIFLREHNRLCDKFSIIYPSYDDELLYQLARKCVYSYMQNITYSEYLPSLLGKTAIPPYKTYNPEVNASAVTEFSTVGYRFGHSMIPENILVGPNKMETLATLFFNPSFASVNGIDNVIWGGCNQLMQQIDSKIVEGLRNFLFGPPTAIHLMDLASLNIQRGRDHGISGYNDVRVAYGLPRLTQFTQITSDIIVSTNLSSVYSSVDVIDPWIGCLSEDHLAGLPIGPLIYNILQDQFTRLRDGDRFWFLFDKSIPDNIMNEILNTKLSDIINRNSSVKVHADVFHMP